MLRPAAKRTTHPSMWKLLTVRHAVSPFPSCLDLPNDSISLLEPWDRRDKKKEHGSKVTGETLLGIAVWLDPVFQHGVFRWTHEVSYQALCSLTVDPHIFCWTRKKLNLKSPFEAEFQPGLEILGAVSLQGSQGNARCAVWRPCQPGPRQLVLPPKAIHVFFGGGVFLRVSASSNCP